MAFRVFATVSKRILIQTLMSLKIKRFNTEYNNLIYNEDFYILTRILYFLFFSYN